MTQRLLNTRCFLLDMDGTFYLGDQLIEGALRFIDTIQRQGRDFVFLTNNSSRNRHEYARKITRMGLPIRDDKVFTSGEAAALYLQERNPGARLAVFGTPGLEDEINAHGFEVVDERPEVVLLGFDTTLTYQKLWRLCDLVRAGLPYIATHGDLNCPTPTGFMPDIGAMISFVETSTGRLPDVVIGKPNRIIITMLANKIGIPEDQLTMVGDRLYTDIALGDTSPVTTVLVLSGETQLDDLKHSPYRPDSIFANLGALADWLEAHHPL